MKRNPNLNYYDVKDNAVVAAAGLFYQREAHVFLPHLYCGT